MPRKPTPIELAGGKGKRQRVWEAIRRLHAQDEPISDTTIYGAIPRPERGTIEMEMIRDYRRCLLAGGVLQTVTKHTARSQAIYRLARDCGIEAPRFTRSGQPVVQGRAQEQMWRTLRLLGNTDTNARELSAHASTPDVPVAESAAKDYLRRLNAAGYLICTREGHGTGDGGVQARYRLKASRNTGPRPPMICRTKVVWDPNENKVVWMPPVTEEDAIHGR